MALFASWETFRFIGEKQPGSIVINAGYQDATGSERMRELSRLQSEALTPWDSVRHDYVTLQMALDHLRREKPRMIYISLGETDDWAHDRRYDRVLAAIQYFDQAIRQVYEFVESSPEYRGKTSSSSRRITVVEAPLKTGMDMGPKCRVQIRSGWRSSARILRPEGK